MSKKRTLEDYQVRRLIQKPLKMGFTNNIIDNHINHENPRNCAVIVTWDENVTHKYMIPEKIARVMYSEYIREKRYKAFEQMKTTGAI